MINFDIEDLGDIMQYKKHLEGYSNQQHRAYISVLKHMALAIEDKELHDAFHNWFKGLFESHHEEQEKKQEVGMDLGFINDEHLKKVVDESLEIANEIIKEKPNKIPANEKAQLITAFIIHTYPTVQGRAGEYGDLKVIFDVRTPEQLEKMKEDNYIYIPGSYIYIGDLKASGGQEPKKIDLDETAMKFIKASKVPKFPTYGTILGYCKKYIDDKFNFDAMRYKETTSKITKEQAKMIKELMKSFGGQRHTLMTAIDYYYKGGLKDDEIPTQDIEKTDSDSDGEM